MMFVDEKKLRIAEAANPVAKVRRFRKPADAPDVYLDKAKKKEIARAFKLIDKGLDLMEKRGARGWVDHAFVAEYDGELRHCAIGFLNEAAGQARAGHTTTPVRKALESIGIDSLDVMSFNDSGGTYALVRQAFRYWRHKLASALGVA